MQTSLPGGNIFCYFPYNMKHKIALTPQRTAQLMKSKVVQCYILACHHAIPVCVVSDCDQIITVPNSTAITLNQTIMEVKPQQDFRSPLFLCVDTQPYGSIIFDLWQKLQRGGRGFSFTPCNLLGTDLWCCNLRDFHPWIQRKHVYLCLLPNKKMFRWNYCTWSNIQYLL